MSDIRYSWTNTSATELMEAYTKGYGGAGLEIERRLKRAVDLTAVEAGMLAVLAREEVARHKHPPHDLIRARDKLRERAERGQ